MTLFKWILGKFHKCPESELRISEREIPCHNYWPEHFVAVRRENLEDIRNMDEAEKKAHVADIAEIYNKMAFGRELESMVNQQVYFIAERALGNNQLDFGRGTINGIRLVQERFGDLHAEHAERSKPDEPFNPYEIFEKVRETTV